MQIGKFQNFQISVANLLFVGFLYVLPADYFFVRQQNFGRNFQIRQKPPVHRIPKRIFI
jgi:hypothetical protein